MKFYTENSAYEVDLKEKKIRRLEGKHNPTPRQGEDGQWKSYEAISPIRPAKPVDIVWQFVEDENGEPIAQMTITSPVKSLEELTAGEAKEFFSQ